MLHAAVWNESAVERVGCGEKVQPNEGNWPPLPEAADEAVWEASKESLRASLASLQGQYGLAGLFCRLIHNVYSLGQIVEFRECEGG